MGTQKVKDMSQAEPEVKAKKASPERKSSGEKAKKAGEAKKTVKEKPKTIEVITEKVEKKENLVLEKATSEPEGKADEKAEKTEAKESNSASDDAKAMTDKEASLDKEPAKVHKSVKPNVKKHVHGKKYRKIEGLVEKGKEYPLDEAIGLLKKTSVSKFDSSVEVHTNLNIDPANADHQVRGSVALPAGSGRTKKVCVVCGADKEKEAKDAGAETVGGQNIIDKIEKGWLDFDVLVATQNMMGALGKIGKILGTKGLMPNPKTGTVTQDVGKVVAEIKKGRAEYRADAQGIVHSVIGKVSFSEKDLKDNYETLMDAIHHAKPANLKGTFIKSIFLTTTMGPGIKLGEK